MWFDQQISSLLEIARYSADLAGTLLGFVVLIVSALTVKCPKCAVSLVWFGISQKTVGGWLSWLLDETTCPKCGFSHRNGDETNAL